MTVDDPKAIEAIVIVLLILYMTIKDVVAPMVKRITGQSGDDVSKTQNSLVVSMEVLKNTVDHMKEDISEIKDTLKASARKRKG